MNDPRLSSLASGNWEAYAALELPISPEMEAISPGALESRLREALRPLDLPPDFANKVIASAQDAAVHIPVQAGHIHLLVYTPAAPGTNSRTWGFFRVVKNEASPAGATGSIHTISLYLYVEGGA